MVYSSSKKTSRISSLVNQNSGGGSKKAGFPYQIGRNSWSSIYIDACDPSHKRDFKCCTLDMMKKPEKSTTSQTRPIGRNFNRAFYKFV